MLARLGAGDGPAAVPAPAPPAALLVGEFVIGSGGFCKTDQPAPPLGEPPTPHPECATGPLE